MFDGRVPGTSSITQQQRLRRERLRQNKLTSSTDRRTILQAAALQRDKLQLEAKRQKSATKLQTVIRGFIVRRNYLRQLVEYLFNRTTDNNNNNNNSQYGMQLKILLKYLYGNHQFCCSRKSSSSYPTTTSTIVRLLRSIILLLIHPYYKSAVTSTIASSELFYDSVFILVSHHCLTTNEESCRLLESMNDLFQVVQLLPSDIRINNIFYSTMDRLMNNYSKEATIKELIAELLVKVNKPMLVEYLLAQPHYLLIRIQVGNEEAEAFLRLQLANFINNLNWHYIQSRPTGSQAGFHFVRNILRLNDHHLDTNILRVLIRITKINQALLTLFINPVDDREEEDLSSSGGDWMDVDDDDAVANFVTSQISRQIYDHSLRPKIDSESIITWQKVAPMLSKWKNIIECAPILVSTMYRNPDAVSFYMWRTPLLHSYWEHLKQQQLCGDINYETISSSVEVHIVFIECLVYALSVDSSSNENSKKYDLVGYLDYCTNTYVIVRCHLCAPLTHRLHAALLNLFKILHQIWCRQQFCEVSKFYLAADNNNSDNSPLNSRLLEEIPFSVPFERRYKLFQELTSVESSSEWTLIPEARPALITIRREYLFEDAFNQILKLGEKFREKVQIQFINKAGEREMGIDGGGLFLEFLYELITSAFLEESYFVVRNQTHLHPNDSLISLFERTKKLFSEYYQNAKSTYSMDTFRGRVMCTLQVYEFLGMIIGKALISNVLAEPMFSLPFLNNVVGNINLIDDLRFLDEDFYTNLIKLKTMRSSSSTYDESDDDLAALDLTFETFSSTLRDGSILHEGPRVVELMEGGHSIKVTQNNIHRYQALMAHHKLNTETKLQRRAFLKGFYMLVGDKIKNFSPHELQQMLSGKTDDLDIEAFKSVMVYSGGYHPSQDIIKWFWEVLSELSSHQQHLFLKFMTSCSRQPILGFQSLTPVPCIQQVRLDDPNYYSNNGTTSERLPTSQTCMNLLKLPNYRSKEVLRKKLLYSIESGVGFELT